MMEYILKVKTITDNFAAIGESIKERDQILQILGGLGLEYNSIVASLTSRDEDLSLHSIHSILFTHEQRLQLQQSLPPELVPLTAHVAATTPQYNNMRPNTLKRYQQRPPHQHFIRSTQTQAYKPPPQRFFASHHLPSLPARPQCQLCGKFGHVAMKCYHRFDISFQGPSPQPSSFTFANSQKNSPYMHAMLASGTTSEDWFFYTGATHHLAKDHTILSNVHPYLGTDQVTIGNGHTLPIAHTGKKQFSYSSYQFILQQVLHVPQLSTNLISVSKFCIDISFTLITFL